ncbi:MAG: hypothetical protein MZW92_22240 [Comamonadaceae bacterium]|nr:hypothetical protein [Comamonadaceae bacterium]
MLDDAGLAATLDWYLKGFSERTGVPVEFVHSGMEERPAPEVETCLFRVVQEATTNIARHAGRHLLPGLPAAPAGQRRADGGRQRRRVRPGRGREGRA